MPPILPPGVYPAAVTPFIDSGALDGPSLMRLLAFFDAAGCKGVVLAGTNGEGPSLSSFEKRDLLRSSHPWAGRLKLILGIATSSLTEAKWLCRQAGTSGAEAVLVMPPSYFRNVDEVGLEAWFKEVLDSSPVPVLVYNFPKMSGLALSPSMIGRLGRHSNMLGVKDSSGEASNLSAYREVLGVDKQLFVGDETLLVQALRLGWSGTISGASNVMPTWMSKIVRLWEAGDTIEATKNFEFVLPVIAEIRRSPQPATHKAVLQGLSILATAEPRLPLVKCGAGSILDLLASRLGIRPGELGLTPAC